MAAAGDTGAPDGSTAPLGLHTDLYELRMVTSYLAHGQTAEATFSLFVRPDAKRPWLLGSGLDLVFDVLDHFRYGPDELTYLEDEGIPAATLDWLRDIELTGEVRGVPDGTIVLGNEPLLEVTAPLPVAQLLETALLNVVQFDTMIATKAARCVQAAGDRTVVDFGFRRAHGLEAGHRAARAGYLAGVASTSNVEAGRRYGIPISGTMAHSFVQSYDEEAAAFRDFGADHPGTILLVDTYDTMIGVERAIEVATDLAAAGTPISGIRIDSEPLGDLARQARQRLDASGLDDLVIVVSGGLDEYAIADLVADGAPIDGFGVGTRMVTSSDDPSLDIVYKLVAYDGRPRAKYSAGKRLLPGAKQVFRRDADPRTDVLARREETLDGDALLVPVWRDGQRLVDPDLETSRARAADQLAALPAELRFPDDLDGPLRPAVSGDLQRLADETEARERS